MQKYIFSPTLPLHSSRFFFHLLKEKNLPMPQSHRGDRRMGSKGERTGWGCSEGNGRLFLSEGWRSVSCCRSAAVVFRCRRSRRWLRFLLLRRCDLADSLTLHTGHFSEPFRPYFFSFIPMYIPSYEEAIELSVLSEELPVRAEAALTSLRSLSLSKSRLSVLPERDTFGVILLTPAR